MSVSASESTPVAAEAKAQIDSHAKAEPAPFEETDEHETSMSYGHGSFVWPMRILWAGLVVLSVWYVAQYYAPSLVAWIPWRP